MSGQRAEAGDYRAMGEHCRKGKEPQIGRLGMPASCAAAVEMEWVAFGEWLIRGAAARLSPMTPSGQGSGWNCPKSDLRLAPPFGDGVVANDDGDDNNDYT